MSSNYQEYEVVRVVKESDTLPGEILGLEGAILGIHKIDKTLPNYTVYIYAFEEVFYLSESDIQKTGKMDKAESFFDGNSVSIIVDPESFHGDYK